jgi:DNA (cytosine-5)-methyltransferase 1
MRLLDLFCGAGGAGMGYHRAGFTGITGVDIRPQPRYPFRFVQGDALEFLRGVKAGDFDLIHASPPCQRHSAMTRCRGNATDHPELIEPVRSLLEALGTPYVIENVPGAPLLNPLLLCGSMFRLRTREGSPLYRHRLFEAPQVAALLPPCAHSAEPAIGVYGGGQHPLRRLSAARPARGWGRGTAHDHYGVEARREAMDIDWMTSAELSQAIPPAYTEFIGRRMLEALS